MRTHDWHRPGQAVADGRTRGTSLAGVGAESYRMTWHIITGEYPPAIGGVSSYTQLVAEGLAAAGDAVHVWCPGQTEASGGDANGVTVHRALGELISRPTCGTSIGSSMRFPARSAVLVQWVPHAFGYRSMNVGFCRWLWRRARRGDRVDIMVHEPYFAFGEGGVRWTAAALVHRLMTTVLARAACRVWISIPAWEKRWRPYFFGRDVPVAWLPVPSTLPAPRSDDASLPRQTRTDDGGLVVGYLGSYGSYARDTLSVVLPHVLKGAPTTTAVLLGREWRRLLAAFDSGQSSTAITNCHQGNLEPRLPCGGRRGVRPHDPALPRRHQQPPNQRYGRTRARPAHRFDVRPPHGNDLG